MGYHNIKNALAVYAMGRAMGLQRDKILDGFATFRGVKRRQEVKGERRGITVIDDFAHHPTAVRETINAVKRAYPERRIWAVFEPRSHTSRRKIFEHEFAQTLGLADRIVIGDVYLPEKVPENERLSVANVIDGINRKGGARAVQIVDAGEIAAYVASNAAAGDIVLIMSNGAFGGVHEKILQTLA
jgi:UDP-N-acetylmuramate: L-alanyl-gamma-D-glutamyl-meso-diaminopimelate ligase